MNDKDIYGGARVILDAGTWGEVEVLVLEVDRDAPLRPHVSCVVIGGAHRGHIGLWDAGHVKSIIKRPWPMDGDRVLTPYGFAKVTAEHLSGARAGMFQITMEQSPMVKENYWKDDLLPEKFIEFCTRPNGFGNMPWLLFTAIQGVAMACIWAAISGVPGYVGFLITGLAIETVLAAGTYIGFKRSRQ